MNAAAPVSIGSSVQLLAFACVIVLVGSLTWWRTRIGHAHSDNEDREFFLAGGSLT